MLKIHTKDGKTTRIDLTDTDQAREWLKKLKEQEFQKLITGISITQKCEGRFKCPSCNKSTKLICSKCKQPINEVLCGSGVQYSLSRPSGFNKVFYQAEYIQPNEENKIRGGEKIICFCDDTQISMMIHKSQKAARITLTKPGVRRFSPYNRNR